VGIDMCMKALCILKGVLATRLSVLRTLPLLDCEILPQSKYFLSSQCFRNLNHVNG